MSLQTNYNIVVLWLPEKTLCMQQPIHVPVVFQRKQLLLHSHIHCASSKPLVDCCQCTPSNQVASCAPKGLEAAERTIHSLNGCNDHLNLSPDKEKNLNGPYRKHLSGSFNLHGLVCVDG